VFPNNHTSNPQQLKLKKLLQNQTCQQYWSFIQGPKGLVVQQDQKKIWKWKQWNVDTKGAAKHKP
jgi:hypothetical protein